MEVSPQLQVAAALTLPLRKKDPGDFWMGGWVGLFGSLVATKKRIRQAMYV